MSAVDTTADDETATSDVDVAIRATGLGYEYVADARRAADERPVYLHRLAAVAWGLLDGLDDGRHVHHAVPEEWLDERDTRAAGIPWLTTEATLVAEDPPDHAAHHFGGRR